MKIEIELDGAKEQIIDQIAMRVLDTSIRHSEWDEDGESVSGPVSSAVRKALQIHVRRAADEQVKGITEAAIREAVDEALAEGWQTTNSYGEPKGPRVTLKERISSMLTESIRDPYGSSGNGGPRIDVLIREALKQALDKEFSAVIKDAKARFTKALDDSIQTRLAETLKAALGLR